jgi:hypothetical protein
MPPAVLSSASSRLTTILSFNGTTFIASVLLPEVLRILNRSPAARG